MEISRIRYCLGEKANHNRAHHLYSYFRADHYELNDKFLGLSIPEIRLISKEVGKCSFPTLRDLINSRIHEERTLALVNLINQFESAQKKGEIELMSSIFDFYMKEALIGIDNWDLVDIGAHKIVGKYLVDKPELKER
jgi:hypothetical protein